MDNVTVTETASGISNWIIPAITTGFFTIVGTFIAYRLTLRRDKQQEKKDFLTKHFEQHMVESLSRIGSFNGLTVQQDKSNELVFVSGGQPSRIEKEYDFGKGEPYEAFKIHFPEDAKEWEQLHKRALELKDNNQNGRLDQDELKVVSEALQKLSIKVHNKREDIPNYQIGTVYFNYEKKYPICKKF